MSRRRKPLEPEDVLGNIRKLGDNRICPDCGKESQFGFGAVVMPFKSFVCDLCKSAHQSYSHRVKSVTMSNWNMDEVKVLAAENGGGNLRVLDTWHGGMSAAECGRPSPQSDLNAIKRFVQRVYIDKAFYRDAPLRTTSKPKHSAPKAQKSPQQKKKAPVTSPVLPSAVPAPGGVTTASDLLSFEAFPPPAPAARTADFVADFGDFAAPPSGVPAAANLSNLSSSSSSSSSFAFMNSSSSGSTNGNTQNNGSDCSQFGDFSNFASSSQQISTAMNGGGGPASTTSFDSLTSSTVGSSTNSSMSGSPGVFDPFATTSAPPVLTASQSVPVTTNYSAAAMGRHGGLMPQPMSTGNLMQQQQQQMQQQRQQQMQQQMQHHPAMTAQAPGMIQRSFSAPSASQASAMANNSSAAISMMMGPGGGGQRGPYLTPQQQAWLSQQQQQAGTAASNDPFAGLGSMKQRI